MKMGRRPSARELARQAENDALSREAKARRDELWRPKVCCSAPGCAVEIKRGMLFCGPHWWSLPAWLRRSIVLAYHHRLRRDYAQLYSQAIVLLERAA